MTDVHVTIDGVVLYCDETLEGIILGNGYTIRKHCLDDLPYKNRLIDGNGKISINYLGSRKFEDNKIYFMCLHKEDIYQIKPPEVKPGIVITDRDTMCEEQLDEYKEKELAYIRRQFSLLRLFKKGNIGCKEIFFTHKFNVFGIISNTQNQTSDSVTRNIVDSTIYTLSENEVTACNSFLQTYSGKEFDILRDCIDEFLWGLEGTDIATAFEQYTTALEMIFLAKNQQNKKQVLSKRIAVLLGTTSEEIDALYKKMLNYYRFRSESLHEGNGSHITNVELKELEDITREVLCKYLIFCKQEVTRNSNITWKKIKSNKISDLKNQVKVAIDNGILPRNEYGFLDRVKKFIKRVIHKLKTSRRK